MSKKQYNNRLNGFLWLVVAVLLTGFLISRLDISSARSRKWVNPVKVLVNGVDWSASDDTEGGIDAADASYHFDFAGLKKIDIQCVSEQVEIREGQGSSVDVGVTYDGKYWTEMIVECNGSTLRIYPKNKNRKNFGNMGKCHILVAIPKSRSNADYRLEVSNVSGSVTVSDVACKKLDLSTVSGSLHYDNVAGPLLAKTVSGSVHGSYDRLEDDQSVETVSGSIHLTVPERSSFEASYETISGSVNTSFKQYGGKREGTIVNGDGDQQLELRTVSGSIHLN